VTAIQQVSNVIQINTPGPQGPAGTSSSTTSTGSLLTTASVSLNTITFTKGDGSTFPITVNTGSSGTNISDYVTTSSFNAFTSSVVTTSSFNAFTSSYNTFSGSYNTGSFTGSFVGSLQGTSSWANNASTASYYVEIDPVFVAKSASLATTGSNAFLGNQTITGSLTVSGSSTFTNIGPAIFSGSVSSNGGFTGSLQGTASWAQSASNAINAQTASAILGGSINHVPYFITNNTLATSSIYQSGSNTVIINQNAATSTNPEALYVWQPSKTSFNVISGKGELDNYLQLNIQNTDVGTNASSDVVATSNNGNESTNYIDMGINNENYNSGFIGAANDAYLYSTGRHLHIGNVSNYPVQIFAGGSNTDASRKLEIRHDNQHSMTGSFDISGSLNVRNNLTSSGLLTNGNNTILGNTVMSGSSTIQGTTTMTGSLNITGITTQIGTNTLAGNTILSGSIIISGSTTTPITPTIKIYGDMETDGVIKFMPVSKNIDTSISASYIFVSGSTNDLYFSQNGNGYNNVTRLRWLESNLYTGLLHGGIISQVNSNTYRIGSGSGIIVDLNVTVPDDPYPVVQFLEWGNLTNTIDALSGSFDQQFVAINSSNQIYAQGIPYNNGDYNDKIPIGIVLHQNRSTINGVQTFPGVAYGWKQRSFDFIKAFGALKISGYTLSQSGSSARGLLLSGGTSWVDGRNYTIDPTQPSYIEEAVGTPTSKIFRYYQSGSDFVYNTNGGAGFTDIDPTQYSNAGTLSSVDSNKWTIQRVFYFPNSATKALFIYYGNAQYANEADALAAVNTEIFTEAPNTAASAIYIGYMLLRDDADFNTAASYEFYAAGLFRGVGTGGSGGGGGGGATSLAGLTDVQITSPTNGQPLVYNSTATKWENNSSLTASLQGTASWAINVVNGGGNVFPYTGSATITGSLVVTGSTTSTLGFTGSLFGTSSWAISASQAISSSFTTSASYATTAQNVLGSVASADTASYSTNFTVANTLIIDQTLTDYHLTVAGTTGTWGMFSQATGSYRSAHAKYTLYNGSNARAGEFVTVWNGTTTTYYDNATTDIGSTSDLVFQSSILTSNIKIDAVAASGGWTIKMLVTYI